MTDRKRKKRGRPARAAKSKAVFVRLEPEEHARLRELAAAEGVSMSECVRRYYERGLAVAPSDRTRAAAAELAIGALLESVLAPEDRADVAERLADALR